jgi:hypothetical protein
MRKEYAILITIDGRFFIKNLKINTKRFMKNLLKNNWN